MRRFNGKGFTMIEILIVAILMAMLLVYSIPQMFKFNRRQITTEQSRALEGGFVTAHSLATSGVQNPARKVDNYRIKLLKGGSGPTLDPPGCYRGYQIQGIDKVGLDINPILERKALLCPMIIESSWEELDLQTITGQAQNMVGSEQSLIVCYPDLGYIKITINKYGKVFRDEFVNFSASSPIASCSCSACNPLP